MLFKKKKKNQNLSVSNYLLIIMLIPSLITLFHNEMIFLANNWFNDLQLQMNNLKNQIQELQTPPPDKVLIPESFNKQEQVINQKNVEPKKLVVPMKIHSPPNSRTPNSPSSSSLSSSIKSIPQSQKSPNRNISEVKNKKEQTPNTSEDPLLLRRQKRENDRKNFRDFLKNQRQIKVTY